MVLLAMGVAFGPLSASIREPASENKQPETLASDLQSIEQAGLNFPGSAFYFLDPNYATPQSYDSYDTAPQRGGDIVGDGLPISGARAITAARSVLFRGSATDNNRAQTCLTTAIYYEAGLEPDAGQRAVAQVILNRVRHPSYPSTVCGVIYQGSERSTGCQFSFSCDGAMARTPSRIHWKRASLVAADALSGKGFAPAGHATHYHTTEVSPYWAPSLHFMGTIGAHRFYRWKGNAGKPGAFYQTYRGREPLPQPKPKAKSAVPPMDPVQLAKAFNDARAKAEEEAKAAELLRASVLNPKTAPSASAIAPKLQARVPTYKAPKYSAEAQKRGGEDRFAGQKMPDAGQIKPEYKNSGTWKKRPGE